MNLAYLYQRPMFAVMPNEAMGNFDLCRHAELYTPGSMVCKARCAFVSMCVWVGTWTDGSNYHRTPPT